MQSLACDAPLSQVHFLGRKLGVTSLALRGVAEIVGARRRLMTGECEM